MEIHVLFCGDKNHGRVQLYRIKKTPQFLSLYHAGKKNHPSQ